MARNTLNGAQVKGAHNRLFRVNAVFNTTKLTEKKKYSALEYKWAFREYPCLFTQTSPELNPSR